MPIRLHLDEHVPHAVAVGLRSRGIDVTTTVDAGLRSATDREQLGHAKTSGRVLVTSDADFLRLHSEGVDHAGIVFVHPQRMQVGHLVRALVLLIEALAAEDMAGHVEFF